MRGVLDGHASLTNEAPKDRAVRPHTQKTLHSRDILQWQLKLSLGYGQRPARRRQFRQKSEPNHDVVQMSAPPQQTLISAARSTRVEQTRRDTIRLLQPGHAFLIPRILTLRRVRALIIKKTVMQATPLTPRDAFRVALLQYLSSCLGQDGVYVALREIAEYLDTSLTRLYPEAAALAEKGYLALDDGTSPGSKSCLLTPASWPQSRGAALYSYFVWKANARRKQRRTEPGIKAISRQSYPFEDGCQYAAGTYFSGVITPYDQAFEATTPTTYPAEFAPPTAWAVASDVSAHFNYRLLGGHSKFLLRAFTTGLQGDSFASLMDQAAPSVQRRIVLGIPDTFADDALLQQTLASYHVVLTSHGEGVEGSGTSLDGTAVSITGNTATASQLGNLQFRFLGTAANGVLMCSVTRPWQV